MGFLLSIASPKGGVGKTTTTLNLGLIYSISGKRTLIVDADPQGGILFGLNHHYERRPDEAVPKGLYQIFCGEAEVMDCIQKTETENLFIMDCGISRQIGDIESFEESTRASGLFKSAMEQILISFDVILIDCPPGTGLIATAAITASHFVIIPIQSEPLSLRALPQLLRQMIAVKKSTNDSLELAGLLLTMHDDMNEASRWVAQQLREHFDQRFVFQTTIPRDPSVNLLFMGQDGISEIHQTLSPNSPGIAAYQQLANEILTKIG